MFSDRAHVQVHPCWTLDRHVFDATLREHAIKNGVVFVSCSRIRSERKNAEILFDLETFDPPNPRKVSTPILIEATGRGPGFTSEARRAYHDRLVALAIDVTSPSVGDGLLRVIPTREGWWYWVDRPSPSQTLVYLTDGDLLPPSPDGLLAWLEAEGSRDNNLPKGEMTLRLHSSKGEAARPTIVDARTGIRREWGPFNRLPIGDAAFTLDPLSGSGLSRALEMANQASTSADEYLATGDPETCARLMLAFIDEYRQNLIKGRLSYNQAATRFPESTFWQRRRENGNGDIAKS